MKQPSNERGSAMVLAIGVLAVLAVLAMVIVAVVVSEKRTNMADYSGTRSFYSADAATEAGINWILNQVTPPPTLDAANNVFVPGAFTNLGTNGKYEYNIQFIQKQIRPGWSVEYKDYTYVITATGASTQNSQSQMLVGATRLYREGY